MFCFGFLFWFLMLEVFYLYPFYFIFLFQNKVSKVVAECEKGTHKDICIVVKSVLAQSGVY